MAKESAVVLANGSLNSSVILSLAAQKYRIIPVMLLVDPPGSRAEQAFDQALLEVKPFRSHKLPMQFLHSMTSAEDRGIEADPRSSLSAVQSLIQLLPVMALGMRYATHYSASCVFLGSRLGPDSSELTRVGEYAQIWTELLQMTCDRTNLDVQMPLLDLDQWQLIDLGVQVDAPLHHSWSCYSLVGEACGQCRGCRDREAAFVRSGRPDRAKR